MRTKLDMMYEIYRKLFKNPFPTIRKIKVAAYATEAIMAAYTVAKQDAMNNQYRLEDIKEISKRKYAADAKFSNWVHDAVFRDWLFESIEKIYFKSYKGEV